MTAISLPFRIDGYGKVATTADIYRIYADRVRSLVSTYQGERLMLPEYGGNVARSLFDSLDNAQGLVEMSLADAFSRWLPELTFVGVDLVSQDDPGGESRLTVRYEVPEIAVSPPDPTSQVVDVVVVLN